MYKVFVFIEIQFRFEFVRNRNFKRISESLISKILMI
jgi:hypothetical protein